MSDAAHKAEAAGQRDASAAGERDASAADVLAEAQRASGGIAIQCQFCVGRNFRRSRLRRTDIKQLLLMRYPVRCLRCSQRQMVSFSVAGISIPSHAKHVPERAGSGAGARHPASAAARPEAAGGSDAGR